MVSSHTSALEMMSGMHNFNHDGSRGMHFAPGPWGSGYATSTDKVISQGPYAIQKFSNHSDDPYVATGIIPTPSLQGNHQAPFTSELQNLHTNGLSKNSIAHPIEHAANYVDSGYGGSHFSYGASSPSIQTVRTDEPLNLKCTHCDHEAKNNSELRKHINRHNKPHKCAIGTCTKGFATQNDLDRHKRTVHRKEYPEKGNSLLYECLHCRDQRGKSNTRKKIEWPRKDNFLAHLDRIHHIRYKPSDNLDQYIVRVQNNPQDINDDMASACEQAQQLALQGIGTGAHADLNGPHSRTAFANELAPGDQADDVFQEQRISMFIHRNSHVLANASVLEPFPQQDFVTLHMLNGHENNLAAPGAGLHIASNDGLQQTRAHPPDNMPPVGNGHQINSDALLEGHGRVTNHSHDGVSDVDDSDENVSDNAKGISPIDNTGTVARQDQPELAPPSMYTAANHDPMAVLGGLVQSQSTQSTASEEILRFLNQIPRETLQAALDRREALESDERDKVEETSPSSKVLNYCPTCRKGFKRPCELTKHKKRHSRPYCCTWRYCCKSFGSKNDWKRHESKQHYNLESWVCNEDGCEHEWNRRERFELHLKHSHLVSPEDVDHKVDSCRQGRHSDADFWCGFCVRRIAVDRHDGAGNAWSQRFDHIDAHFCGKGIFLVQQGMADWKHEIRIPADSKQCTGEIGPSSPGAATSPTGLNLLALSQKRPADAVNSASPRAKRKRSKWVVMWKCCECDMVMNLKTSPACVSCGRLQCQGCRITRDMLLDEVVPETGGSDEVQLGLDARCPSPCAS